MELTPTTTMRPNGLAASNGNPNSMNELSTQRAAAMEKFEIESAITIAKSMPRDELEAANRLMRSCERPRMAADATYTFPRGSKKISGPSVKIAREAMRIWGNIRIGVDVVREDDTTRLIRGWAWDLETNTKVTADDLIEKVIERKRVEDGESVIGERKNSKGETLKLIRPSERDMRELQNRRGAFLIRNCILSLIPPDVIDSALDQAKQTLHDAAGKNLPEARAKTLQAFTEYGVTQAQLERYIGRVLGQFTPADIVSLRTIYVSIRDGNSKKEEYFGSEQKQASAEATQALNDLLGTKTKDAPAPAATPPEEPNQMPMGKPATIVDTQRLDRILEGFEQLEVQRPTIYAFFSKEPQEFNTDDIEESARMLSECLADPSKVREYFE